MDRENFQRDNGNAILSRTPRTGDRLAANERG